MATLNKNFKVKHGLVVEGTTATVNNYDILTKKQDDVDYIVNLIGGTATALNENDTVVKRDGSGNFAAGTITADLVGDVTGNADTAIALETSRTIELTGDVTGSVSFDGASNVQISTTLNGSFATDAEVATAKGEAIATAGDYTDQEISDLDVALKLYADQAEADAISTAAADATLKADQAEADAISAAALDATTKANAAEAAAKLYADGLAVNYDAAGSAAQALEDANDYTDTKVAALVDGAPELLDTLNELAAAIADNPNYATDVAILVATKADTSYVDQEIADAIQATTYTAGTNIDITGNVVSVTGLDSADISDFNTAAVSANTGLWDTLGAAATAEENAKDYADGLAVNYDPAGSASAAQTAAETYALGLVNALDTDAIEEGATNLYFTNSRAQAAVAGDISSAINALDTDDIEEGSTNLYFTDSRAQDAVAQDIADAVAAGDGTATPEYLAVNIADVAKQVASTLSAPTAGIQSAFSWVATDYRSAEFLVKVAYGTHTEISKVLLTLDTSDNIAITEYGIVGTNGSASSISASVSAGNVSLDVTTTNNNSTVTVVGTLLV